MPDGEIKWLMDNGFHPYSDYSDYWMYKTTTLQLNIYINGYDRASVTNLVDKDDDVDLDELLEIADLVRVWHRKFGNKNVNKS